MGYLSARSLKWLVVAAPVFLLALATLLGSYTSCKGEAGCEAPDGLVIGLINRVVVGYGPLLPLALLLFRGFIMLCSYRSYPAPFVGGYWIRWLLLIWIVVVGVRILCYVVYMGPSKLFSDHLFLMMSIIACVEMELAVAHVELEMTGNRFLVLPLLASWALLLALFYEAWTTAHYYHSAASLGRAFCAGLPFFVLSWKWLEALSNEQKSQATDCGPTGAGALPLLGN